MTYEELYRLHYANGNVELAQLYKALCSAQDELEAVRAERDALVREAHDNKQRARAFEKDAERYRKLVATGTVTAYSEDDLRAYAAECVAAERERMIADGWRKTRYVAPVTDCEACLTPDACGIRGQCGHYLRERA